MNPRTAIARQRIARSVNSVFEPLEGRTLYATYTVTNINDDGPGSLRQAIATANNSGAVDVIKFNIPGAGVHTISPQSALPNLSWNLTIDGTSQPGYAGKPLIEIEGTDAGANADGLVAFRSGIHIKGLCINRFGAYGIMAVTGGNSYKANFIGTDPTGMLDYGNGRGGINLFAANNVVGGTSAADRNVISGNDANSGGNGFGLSIRGDDNTVQGNYIGVAADGVTPLGNAKGGVMIAASNNNNVGGTAAGAKNVIAHNGGAGVYLTYGAKGSEILGNSIYANAGSGIDLDADDLFIADGLSPNDGVGDEDDGGNHLQNFPELSQVTFPVDELGNEKLAISGSLQSKPSRTYRIEFFASDLTDLSGYGQGQRYIGSKTVTTDASGNANYTATFGRGSVNGIMAISATATDQTTDDTSEFGRSIGALALVGTDGDDTIAISESNGIIDFVMNGVSTKFESAGIDLIALDAKAGNDKVTFVTAKNAYVLAGAGRDTIVGGSGRDTINGGGASDQIYGGDGDDRLNGAAAHDLLFGEGGNDRLYGMDGLDYLNGAAGVDRLFGGFGTDTLLGGTSNDKLYGEGDDDYLNGQAGTDLYNGGDGNDTLFSADSIVDYVTGGDGADTATVDANVDLVDTVETVA